MTRQLLLCCSAACLPMIACAANAVDLPIRKPGLWEMRVVGGGFNFVWRGQPDVDRPSIRSMREMNIQHCTDETTDREMSTASSPMMKDVCSKRDVQETATGYVSDSVCDVAGISMTTHAEITGDFKSAYTVKSTSHGMPRDSTTTIEAKWLGDCKSDQKPGDIMMPGGFKMNIKEIERVKDGRIQLPK